MTTVYLYAFIDRHLLSLLVDPVRTTLGLSDTAFSLAHGFVFALTLGVACVPAGRVVDRGSRVRVLAAAIALWSAMTLATGLANSFAMLLVCRIGVALGQSALNPATYALIADRFPPNRLGLALGIFGMAPHLGVGLANLAGAAVLATMPPEGIALPLLGALQPWQIAFFTAGAPGLALTIVVLCLPETGRTGSGGRVEGVPLSVVLDFFKCNLRSFAFLKLATAFAALAVHAIAAWSATLLVRNYGWSAVAAASALGPVFLVAGAGGALAGGALGDWQNRLRGDGRIRAIMVTALSAAPFGACATVQDSPQRALVLLGLAMFFASAAIAINPAATMAMMPPRMRGVATAVGVLMVNAIGLGLGPLAVALVADHLIAGPNALGRAMAAILPASLVASAICAGLCRTTYVRSLDAGKAASAR
jgi:MFS family permease